MSFPECFDKFHRANFFFIPLKNVLCLSLSPVLLLLRSLAWVFQAIIFPSLYFHSTGFSISIRRVLPRSMADVNLHLLTVDTEEELTFHLFIYFLFSVCPFHYIGIIIPVVSCTFQFLSYIRSGYVTDFLIFFVSLFWSLFPHGTLHLGSMCIETPAF